MNTFFAESFTNDVGQVINPGDRVAAVTTGFNHRVDTISGVFAGVYKDAAGKVVGTRVNNVPDTDYVKEYREDGKFTTYSYDVYDHKLKTWVGKPARKYDLVPVATHRVSVLKRNRLFKL